MKKLHRSSKKLRQTTAGFTLIEVLVVVATIAILSAIGGLTWLGFVNSQRLSIANDANYRAMREAQSQGKQNNLTWQASFRQVEIDGKSLAQWAVHRATDNDDDFNIPLVDPDPGPSDPNRYAVIWNSLDENVEIDREETTLPGQDIYSEPGDDLWRMRFDRYGNVYRPPFGRITVKSKNGGTARRCVFVSTYIGGLRTSQDTGCY
ncbi:MAG: Tfp pilus assembly protein FimT/FimU [Hormoscilla sp.]